MCYGGCQCKRCMGPDEERAPMTNNMTWTTTRPTQPGFYFHRYRPDHNRQMVEVVRSGCGCLYVDLSPLVDYGRHGEWAGPIPEPVERDERETQP